MNGKHSTDLGSILQKHPFCFVCGAPAEELHHVFVHNRKGMRDELTVPENLMEVCKRCHTSGHAVANSMLVRLRFLEEQKRRGLDVGKWYRSLNIRVKEHWLLTA